MKHNTVLKKDPRILEQRRMEAIRLFRRHWSQSDIAARLNVTRQAVHLWKKAYVDLGLKALQATKSEGRPPKYPLKSIQSKLPELLKKGATSFGHPADIWTTSSISLLIQKEFGVHYHPDHVRKILRKVGFSWQKPEKRALERNERKIRYWTTHTWEDIKKKPKN